MTTYSAKDGFTVEDMLYFGYGHVDAARTLFEDEPALLDSAGYLAHLGTELILKAWHLQWFGQFDNTHDLVCLYTRIKETDNSLNIGAHNEAFLAELDRFYLLRYPRRKEGPVEIGSNQLAHFDTLHDALWERFPKELRDSYEKLDLTRKGGRVFMKKKIATEPSPPENPMEATNGK